MRFEVAIRLFSKAKPEIKESCTNDRPEETAMFFCSAWLPKYASNRRAKEKGTIEKKKEEVGEGREKNVGENEIAMANFHRHRR